MDVITAQTAILPLEKKVHPVLAIAALPEALALPEAPAIPVSFTHS